METNTAARLLGKTGGARGGGASGQPAEPGTGSTVFSSAKRSRRESVRRSISVDNRKVVNDSGEEFSRGKRVSSQMVNRTFF